MGKVVISVAGPSDIDGLAVLHYVSHKNSFRSFSSAAWLRARDPQHYVGFWSSYLNKQNLGDRTWKATINGEIVGTITHMPMENCSDLFHPTDPGDVLEKELACLRLMYVHPECMRTGIGSQLMSRFLKFTRDQGFVLATLITHAANVSARSFYEAKGWQLDGLFSQQVKEFFIEPVAMRDRARYRYEL